MDVESLALRLFDINAVKFGTFTLKSGIQSPFYIDLRVIVSHPPVLSAVAALMWEKIRELKFQHLCGVPYTALPIATAMSLTHGVPMLMRRKEAKAYGTKKCIEGQFEKGDMCVIIEDLVTSGTSIVETVQALDSVGLRVSDSVVLIDRQQGGPRNLESQGINLHAVTTISEVLDILVRNGRLDDKSLVHRVRKFLAENQQVAVVSSPPTMKKPPGSPGKRKRLSFEERSVLCENPVSKRLFRVMAEKKTNLSVAADVTSAERVLALADAVGPFICCLKTHVDVIDDFSPQFLEQLTALAEKHNFIIFEDRKFADIGNTVKHQFGGGAFRIASWAHLVNAHAVPGPGIVAGLKQVSQKGGKENRPTHGLLMLAEMSSKGNLATDSYTEASVMMAQENKDFVVGFIAQRALGDDPRFVCMTPGVHLEAKGDAVGQQYKTPGVVIGERGSDVIIVGRGVYASEDPARSAMRYRDAAWSAYEEAMRRTKL